MHVLDATITLGCYSCLYSSMAFAMACFCSSLRLASVTGITFSKSKSVFDMLILILNMVPLGVTKDVLMQKQICKHKGLIPDSNIKVCQPI